MGFTGPPLAEIILSVEAGTRTSSAAQDLWEYRSTGHLTSDSDRSAEHQGVLSTGPQNIGLMGVQVK